jgi:hypothetical protein
MNKIRILKNLLMDDERGVFYPCAVSYRGYKGVHKSMSIPPLRNARTVGWHLFGVALNQKNSQD